MIDGAVGDRIKRESAICIGWATATVGLQRFGRRSLPRITMLSSRVRLPELPNGRKAVLFLFFGIILGVEFNVLVGVPVARFLFTLHDIQRRMDYQQALSLRRGVTFNGRRISREGISARGT
jgi:hypothetical protein